MNREQAKELVERYNNGFANAEERAWVENWYLDESRKFQFSEKEADFLHLKEKIWIATLQKSGLGKSVPKRLALWPRIVAAAAILMVVGLSLYFYQGNRSLNNQLAADIAPGGNKAILTLANGQKIVLNDAAKGEITRQSGITVSKSKDGELIYTAVAAEEESTTTIRNTISTPNGGQYTIMLSDGTKVMLNAASSLTFPTALNQKDRLVELKGEAYFEVAKHKNSRFRVISGQQTIEVLGTHFNVNAYADEEAIKTTLLEGAVKVFTPGAAETIEPGEQAVWNKAYGDALVKHRVNTAQETAWINGVFSFDGEDIRSVMRQVSRWYDVNVIYVGPVSEEKYYGEIFRNSKLSEVFKILKIENVHFDVAGKTIKVSYNQRIPVSNLQNNK
ncbi:FecR family protein [Pedobacter sp. MC2016-24]|uniref:FecR family protein n=1 Tax=Pedobacter sp. MC2016-24 TaxID=2780090 RepID=UPI00187ED6F5|nr:FecR family protein [Pedobacter sp. MC2016-24]MBE9600342.1 FecR family protein [Pedobacter sp. MC2016-24]